MSITVEDHTDKVTIARDLAGRGDLTDRQIADALEVTPQRVSRWLAPESKECLRCDSVLRTPARHCGMCEAELLEATLRDLAEPAPASALAILELRDRGLTARQVRVVARGVRRGRSLHEVVTVIQGLPNWRAV
jgi:hypothetical protein